MKNLTYLQLNIWRGGELFNNILDFLDNISPDIISFQEVIMSLGSEYSSLEQTQLMRIIMDRTRLTYLSFMPYCILTDSTSPDLPEVLQGTAVLSAYPITKQTGEYYIDSFTKIDISELEHGLKIPRLLHTCDINIDNKKLTVMNVHGVWNPKHGRDNEQRLQMASFISEKLKGAQYTIISGDFNTDPDTKSMSMIREGLQDPFLGKISTTFNKKQKDTSKVSWDFVVDHTMLSHDIQIHESSVPDVDVSDHLPLIVKFSL